MPIKFVPISEEKAFLSLLEQDKVLKNKLATTKEKMRAYSRKGYTFRLIRVDDNTAGTFSPPWKQLCMELVAQFMTAKTAKLWMKSVIKRFPRTKREAAVRPLKKGEVVNA